MCLAQDVIALRFGPGPDLLVMASLTLFYAVQLARNLMPGRSPLAARAA